MPEAAIPIRLIVLDIDGVLTRGEARPLDLGLLEELAGLNRAARRDPSRPAVTLCTGRAAPYLEVMLQAVDGQLPGVYENGAGLYLPDGYQFRGHPELGPPDRFEEVRRHLEEAMVDTGRAFFQPGKEFTLTLFASDPQNIHALQEQAASALGSLRDTVDLVYSTSCLNVLPRGIHKGKGVAYLADETDYSLEEMLGVGDSDVDLQFLSAVGRSAAPANANQAVKRLVHYVAPRPTADGVRDILAHFDLRG